MEPRELNTIDFTKILLKNLYTILFRFNYNGSQVKD